MIYEPDLKVHLIKRYAILLFFTSLFIINVYISYDKNPEHYHQLENIYYFIMAILIILFYALMPLLVQYEIRKGVRVELSEDEITTIINVTEKYSLKWEDVREIRYKPIFKRLWSIHGRDNYEIYIPKWNFSKEDNDRIYNYIVNKSTELNTPFLDNKNI